MPGLLDDHIALITGAGSGIGEAIAHAMAAAGARIVAADIDGGAAERTAQAIGDVALGFVCDVADRGQCDVLSAEVRQRVGAISILVNNAGIIRRGAVTEPNARQDWDATMAVNLDGPYNMVTAFLDQLKETKGAVVNIGSIQSFVTLPNSAAYTTSKGGVRLLTKALAIELSPLGIRVNAIGPGFTQTPLNAHARENPNLYGQFRRSHSLGPDRHARGHRRTCRLPGLRHGPLHPRSHPASRRRLSRAVSRLLTPQVVGFRIASPALRFCLGESQC